MPRVLTTGIDSELSRSGAYPGFIMEITVASGATVRLTTLDVDFDYAGDTYVSADIAITDMQFDGSVSRGATMICGDQTLAFWIATLYREFDDAQVRAWFVYADAPGEASGPMQYRCGKLERSVSNTGETLTIALDAQATTLFAPRQRVQDVIDQKWLLQAGSIIVLPNGQKWVIDRPKTSNV